MRIGLVVLGPAELVHEVMDAARPAVVRGEANALCFGVGLGDHHVLSAREKRRGDVRVVPARSVTSDLSYYE